MWEKLKNAITGAQDALGVEIPELPVDLAALGETASTSAREVMGSAAGAAEGVAGAAEAATAAGEALPDVPGATADPVAPN